MKFKYASLLLLIAKAAEIKVAANCDTFVPIGDPINGRKVNSELGSALDMSSDGSIIAVASNQVVNSPTTAIVDVYALNSVDQTWVLRRGLLNLLDGDKSGSSVALSGDGNTLVFGARNSNENGKSGKVQAFIFDDTAASWSQRGTDILGATAKEDLGAVVAISSDGSAIVIGSPGSNEYTGVVRVYRFNNNDWIQQGTDIVGEAPGDRVGAGIFNSLAISSNGTVLAVGAWKNDGEDADSDKGNLRVFAFNGTDWDQRGSTIYGARSGDELGRVVSMSADGDIIATSLMYNEEGSETGSVHVYIFNETMVDWTPLGSSINSAGTNETKANSLAMSSDGTVLAIGAKDSKKDIESGSVRVFVYDGGNWTQRGLEINGENGGDLLGSALAISEDGSILAIGALGHDTANAIDSGQLRVVQWDSCSTEPSMVPSTIPSLSPTVTLSQMPTISPTNAPIVSPTSAPTAGTSSAPTTSPTGAPTVSLSDAPTASPTGAPTVSPKGAPTASLTGVPIASPNSTPTSSPTSSPTTVPTLSPSLGPRSLDPTNASVSPTVGPTIRNPTMSPERTIVTVSPTVGPTIRSPTMGPEPTNAPVSPTVGPTARSPTEGPEPTNAPISPTVGPTMSPTMGPEPTISPVSPTVGPTMSPTVGPEPTNAPVSPTVGPTMSPTLIPTNSPTSFNTEPPSMVSLRASSPILLPKSIESPSSSGNKKYLHVYLLALAGLALFL